MENRIVGSLGECVEAEPGSRRAHSKGDTHRKEAIIFSAMRAGRACGPGAFPENPGYFKQLDLRATGFYSRRLWKQHKRCSGDQRRHQGSEEEVQRRNSGLPKARREDRLTGWIWRVGYYG